MRNNIHPIQFSIFRIMLGVYLLLHFIFLFPFSNTLFSNEGMLSSPELNPLYGLFPINLFHWFDEPLFIKLFLILLIFSSSGLILGFKRRWISAILLYGWLALFNRNNFTLTPGIAFIGWLLLAMIFIPEGEPYSFRRKTNTEWEMPQIVFAGAWFIMSLAYTCSGIDKLGSPSWINGTAIPKLLYSPLMRNTTLVSFFQNLPEGVLKPFTYIILFAELLFFPLALFHNLRLFIWTMMVCIHLGILIFMNMFDLSISMLMIHIFTFNPSWLKTSIRFSEPVN